MVYPSTKKVAIHLVLILGSLVMVAPFLWMLFTSFKSFAESMQVPPTILPKVWRLDNYAEVFEKSTS